ncbi:MAG: hypothetical protein ABJO02_16430 [Reichenbachiella sp.]|uniref:hypothetical protein n=1 Tax=Reichenbachiella sp. TaxID=2184521 RepID=UPI003297C133
MNSSFFKVVFCLFCALLLSGCGTPSVSDISFIASVLAAGIILIVGLLTFLVGLVFKGKVLKIQGFFILLTSILFLLAFVVPFFIFLEADTRPTYLLTLGNSILAGGIFWVGAIVMRVFDKEFVEPKYAGLFGAILFFVLTFGYVFVSSEFEGYQDIGYVTKEIEMVLLWSQLPYLAFFLAPLLTFTLWTISWFTKDTWTPVILLRQNVRILAYMIIGLILITSLVNTVSLTDFKSLDLDAEMDYRQYYLSISAIRDIIFFNSCHNIIIGVCLALGLVYSGFDREKLGLKRKQVFLVAGFVVVVMATVPYFMGQNDIIEHLIKLNEIADLARAGFREELIGIHPLYPGSSILQNIIVTFTGGGLLAMLLSTDKLFFKSQEAK